MTVNTNEDFRSNFNSEWASKLIVATDEVLLNRREDSERFKTLSTARTFKLEAKGKDRLEIEFFAKFVLCSNNEDNPVIIDQGETRYWVRKVGPIEKDDTGLLDKMKQEIPAFSIFAYPGIKCAGNQPNVVRSGTAHDACLTPYYPI